MKFLSSLSRTLKRGWYRLMSSFSRRSASFSLLTTTVSTSASHDSRKGMKARVSLLRPK
jgi:hypothetical protein